MQRDLVCRLARAEMLAPAIPRVDRQAAHHRQSLRACVEWCDLIRERFRAMGIDSTLAVALRRGEEAAAELAAIADSPNPKAADEAIVTAEYSNADDRSCEFKAKIERIAEHCCVDLSASNDELAIYVFPAKVGRETSLIFL
jgi:hypothetical protein